MGYSVHFLLDCPFYIIKSIFHTHINVYNVKYIPIIYTVYINNFNQRVNEPTNERLKLKYLSNLEFVFDMTVYDLQCREFLGVSIISIFIFVWIFWGDWGGETQSCISLIWVLFVFIESCPVESNQELSSTTTTTTKGRKESKTKQNKEFSLNRNR